jgi:hypothetical protein
MTNIFLLKPPHSTCPEPKKSVLFCAPYLYLNIKAKGIFQPPFLSSQSIFMSLCLVCDPNSYDLCSFELEQPTTKDDIKFSSKAYWVHLQACSSPPRLLPTKTSIKSPRRHHPTLLVNLVLSHYGVSTPRTGSSCLQHTNLPPNHN